MGENQVTLEIAIGFMQASMSLLGIARNVYDPLAAIADRNANNHPLSVSNHS